MVKKNTPQFLEGYLKVGELLIKLSVGQLQ